MDVRISVPRDDCVQQLRLAGFDVRMRGTTFITATSPREGERFNFLDQAMEYMLTHPEDVNDG